ncbi:hypothetical protein ACPOL_3071 [Acidisarcina polymorpha]|uniref:Uncharacterized protein n=1 Tax=Acidisarcina polymorpha TaxID=2211140 RepID=A0A2Z5FZS5_9BACT|nr:hypothetical protein ACPOL_3071 [Acidisarcina polymorpha]
MAPQITMIEPAPAKAHFEPRQLEVCAARRPNQSFVVRDVTSRGVSLFIGR